MSGQKQHRCGDAVGASSEEEEKTNFYKCLSFSRARKSSSYGMTHISNCSSSCCCHAALFLYIYYTTTECVHTHDVSARDRLRADGGRAAQSGINIYPDPFEEKIFVGEKKESSNPAYTYYVVVVLTPLLFCALCCRWIEL